jgi:hypothetical protein
LGKKPFFLLPIRTGEGGRAERRPVRGKGGAGGPAPGGDWEMERRPRGVDSRAYLALGWSERALKDTPEPRHPHDKKGKKKANEGNDDFQEPDKTVNVLFGGLPNKRAQKATRREVLSIEPAVPTPLKWSEVPINFSHVDQWTSFSEPGRFPLILKPVVAGSRLKKVLIDGGSGLNVLFTKTLKKMKLDITHMLTKSTSPFYGIVPGNAAIPLGSVVLQVTFG